MKTELRNEIKRAVRDDPHAATRIMTDVTAQLVDDRERLCDSHAELGYLLADLYTTTRGAMDPMERVRVAGALVRSGLFRGTPFEGELSRAIAELSTAKE
jgi:hypothetical protein